MKSSIEGKTTYILTHLMATPDGAAYALARRQYYASTSYNGEQSVAGFLPFSDGTVVVLASHVFTDQVAGFGGSMKRSIGSSVMARKMREISKRAGRKSARKPCGLSVRSTATPPYVARRPGSAS